MILLLLGFLVAAGCKQEPQPTPPATASQSAPAAKQAVPLRVWFVGDAAAQPLIQRQWQASSERAIELHMLSPEQLLESTKCDSDVVVFPAHLIGDLTDRQWLVELPSSLAPATLSATSLDSSDADTAAAVQPAAWIDQTRYGRSLWGVTLGASMPVIMSNFELAVPSTEGGTLQAADDSKAFWQAAVAALSEKTSGAKHQHGPFAAADADAVCDRFLVVLTSSSRRESRFGGLLDPETLRARLGQKEFVEAAEILLELHRLNAAPQALAGSYQSAWDALSSEAPCVSIGTPPLPTPEIDKVTALKISLPPLSPGPSNARSAAADRTMGWNSGHGLVASLTSQCRQTSLAIEFVRWLASESSRNALARSVAGVSASSLYAPGSSAWQAQRLGLRIAQQPRLPNEPRMVGSAQYRRALGEQLVKMLSGEQDPETAMQAAAAAWDEITESRDHQQVRASYEASLGL